MADEGEWVDEPQQTAAPQDEGQWVDEPQQAQAQPQDEGQWVDEKQGEHPEPEGALGSTLRRTAHGVIPATVGAAGFGAGTFLGGPLVGIAAGIGAASLAGMAQEKLTKMFGYDDEPQQRANQLAHPWASGAGDVLAGLPTFGLGTEALLATRALNAGIAGTTDYIMGGDPEHAAIAAIGGAALAKPTKLGESLIGAGETAGQKISSLLARSKADLEGAANIGAEGAKRDEATGATPDGAATAPVQNEAADTEAIQAGVKTPANQSGSSNSAGTSTELAPPLKNGIPSREPQSQAPGSEQEYGKASANEVSPPIQKEGEVPAEFQAALKPAETPVPSYIAENRANAVKAFAGTPTESKIVEMARAGNTAKEIESATGVDVDTIRSIRDHHGIAAAGPQVSMGLGRMPPEPPTNAPRSARPTPPPADGDVRFYHGGDNPTTGGSRWVTPDPTYARDFRAHGTPKNVHYVDIPKGDPAEVELRSWDEQLDAGTNAVGHYQNGEIPEALAQKLQPYRAEPPEIAMLKQQAAQREAAAGQPPTIRLYRGEKPGGNPVIQGSPVTGNWFTLNPKKAARFGDVKYTDVTRDELKHFIQGHGGPDEFVTDNPIFRERLQPLKREAAANRAPDDVLRGPDMYAPGSPYEMARAGDLTADKAVEISNKLKENQGAIEDKIFGDKGIADKWRKLQRQSDIAWRRARDKQAREFDEQIFELEKRANLTPKDEAFLNGEGPEYSDPQAWRDHAQDLRNLEGSRKDRVTALGYDLRRLPEEGKVRPEDHWTLAKVQYAMSEEAKAGGDPEALLRDAFNKSAERYGGGADAKEIVQDDMARLKHLMENPEPAPRALPPPPRNEEGGTPSPELNEATKQAVEAAGGGKPPPPPEEGSGKPPPPPEEPPKGGPAEPIPPERYTGGKFDTPLNAANTVNNALDNVVRNQAALWHGFRNLLKDITNKDSSLMGKGGGDISRAIERREFDKLDPKVQEAYNKHIGPINEESAKVAAELDKRGIRPPDEDMASNYIMHNRKMPFSLKEALNNDPTGMLQGMRKPDTFKGLEYRGAVAEDGSRLSIRDLGDKYSVGKNGEESFYNKPESKDGAKMFKNGDEIEYNGKTYKIDRGIQDEITRDFRDEKGRPIEYHQNAILSALERNSQLKAALQYDDMMRTFKTDKALDPYRTTMNDPKAAQLAKAGWEKVDSPGFENILMHPDMAQAIKNNFEPGLFKANPITNFARAMNQFAVRSIFWNPVPHSLNAAVHYIVARGEDWLPVKFEPGTYKVGTVTLDNYRNLMSSLSKAWDTVVNQTPDLVKLNNSGLPMVWSSIERQRAHELTGKLLDTSLKSEPKFWAGMASKYGLGAPVDAVRAVYNSSAKVLWMASDVMTAARYHELMGKGLSSDEAISHMSIHMPDYRPALSLLGVRGLPSAMGDSTLFMFGRYHAGMLRSLENMATGALGKNSTVDERREAFGNIGALFVMGAIVYPLLDKATQVITGNKNADVRRSGPLSPIKNTLSAIEGEGTFGRTLSNLNTLSPLANAAVETLRNKDFSNSDIVAPMSPFYKKADQYADYLARNMVAPYGTAQKMANPKGPGVASTLVHELTGVKVPTPDEIKSKTKRLDRAQSDAAYRDKHPRGMLESLVNKVTPQSPRVRQKDAQP